MVHFRVLWLSNCVTITREKKKPQLDSKKSHKSGCQQSYSNQADARSFWTSLGRIVAFPWLFSRLTVSRGRFLALSGYGRPILFEARCVCLRARDLWPFLWFFGCLTVSLPIYKLLVRLGYCGEEKATVRQPKSRRTRLQQSHNCHYQTGFGRFLISYFSNCLTVSLARFSALSGYCKRVTVSQSLAAPSSLIFGYVTCLPVASPLSNCGSRCLGLQ